MIEVRAASLAMDRGRITADTSGGGNAGSIALLADWFSLANGSEVSSDTTGAGDAGPITVGARGVHLDGSTISSDTSSDGDAEAQGLARKLARGETLVHVGLVVALILMIWQPGN